MVLEKVAPNAAADQPAPVTLVQRALRHLPKSRGKRIACVTVVVLIFAAVLTATSSGPKAVLTSTDAVMLRVTNPNDYGAELDGVKVRITTIDLLKVSANSESLDIATRPLPDMPDSIGVPPDENAAGEVALPIKVEWPLTAAMPPTRALAIGLFECGVEARKIPAALMDNYRPGTSDESIVISVMARKVMRRNGVHIANNVQYVTAMPTSILLCPDESTQPGTWNQTNIERLVVLLNDAWNATKTA